MARIVYPYDPDDLSASHPPFIQDLVELRYHGNHQAVDEIKKMVRALRQLGHRCGFVVKLKHSPILELKPHSRGGNKGGARAYLFEGPHDTFLICRAEWKQGDAPSRELLEDTAYILGAFKGGRPVFPERVRKRIEYLGRKRP